MNTSRDIATHWAQEPVTWIYPAWFRLTDKPGIGKIQVPELPVRSGMATQPTPDQVVEDPRRSSWLRVLRAAAKVIGLAAPSSPAEFLA